MVYRLPFPDIGLMKKVHESAGVTGDATFFLNEIQGELEQPNAILDWRTGWEAYVDTHENCRSKFQSQQEESP